MAIENTVSIEFYSTFLDSIVVFNCRLPGVYSSLLLGIQDICNFTSRDMGYCVQYIVTFRDNGYLEKNDNYGDVCHFIRDTCQFTSRDIGNPLPIQASFMAQLPITN